MTVADANPELGPLVEELRRAAREDSHALVLSGGGANGAYEVGVVRALAEGASRATGYEPLAIQVFSGTSVGAYNAAFLAQEWGSILEATRSLDETWRQRIADTPGSCGNGVYRLRVDPWRWVEPGCLIHPLNNLVETAADSASLALYSFLYGLRFLTAADEPPKVRWAELVDITALFTNAPFRQLLEDTIDLARLARSASELRVVATDWLAGTARVFDKAQIVSQLGITALMASAAIPGLFPPVSIDGRPYVDGALKMNTPLQPAIAAGADVLHVVYVDPDVADIPQPKLPYTLQTFYRIYVILVAAKMNNDIFTLDLINEDRELAERLDLTTSDPRLAGLPTLQRIVRRRESGAPYRPLVVHKYRPKVPLSEIGGLLDFSSRHVDQVIDEGYQDAVGHDCRVEQCILPPAQAVAAGLRD
jgi:predicted acylesterase/phospholipase RssA